LVCWFTINVLLKYKNYALPLDSPNQRSLHTQPTPKGAGIVMVGIVVLVSAALTLTVTGFEGIFLALGISALGFGAVGWWDDHCNIRIRSKLFVELTTGVVIIWLIDLPRELQFAGFAVPPLSPYLLSPIALFWVIWMANLYNFMDGIDGFAASHTIFFSTVLAGWFLLYGDVSTALFCVALAGAGIGVLIFNWSPARVFLGDAGSLMLGSVFALLAVHGVARYQMPVSAFLLLYGVFLFDATATLGRRILTGKRWWEGHATHFYQRAVRSGFSHARASILGLLGTGCLAVLGTLDLLRVGRGVLWFSLGLVLMLLFIIGVRGFEQRAAHQ
jgi:UDP-N-acetylmuramyl pentapeptide phosphotransferase/UDP-N-acetylglucosamine-1-phosphate transferase